MYSEACQTSLEIHHIYLVGFLMHLCEVQVMNPLPTNIPLTTNDSLRIQAHNLLQTHQPKTKKSSKKYAKTLFTKIMLV